MNAVVGTYRNEMDMEVDYSVDYRRDRSTISHRSRRPEHRSRSAAPACVNGIHRRRNKRWSWGTGRGARMSSLRAMASSLALALASLAGAALAAPLPVTIDYATVGNPGNAGLVTSTVTVLNSGSAQTFAQSGTWGSVSEVFKIAKYETTNSDYVKFLNTVDPNGTNPNSIYDPLMTSNTTNGGIILTSTAGAGAKYTVRSGFDLKPVTYVSWFSAARFANWLNNGQTSGTAATETGAYTLNGATSGPLVARNPGAQVYLPNLNEFVKAAFYNPTLSGTGGYYTYGTQNNSAPTPSTASSGSNVANFGGSGASPTTTGVVDGNVFPNTTSYYGLFNAFGNVAEWSETAYSGNNTLANVNGSGWRTAGSPAGAAQWASSRVRYFNTTGLDSYGFRVAAVPEPGAIILAAIGLGGAFGGEIVRRRRRKSRA